MADACHSDKGSYKLRENLIHPGESGDARCRNRGAIRGLSFHAETGGDLREADRIIKEKSDIRQRDSFLAKISPGDSLPAKVHNDAYATRPPLSFYTA